LTEELKKNNKFLPVIVGGEALEIYTQGNYTTGDIDIIINESKKTLLDVLRKWGFKEIDRFIVNEELDIYIDVCGSIFDKKRTNKIKMNDRITLTLISVEDLIIDRFCSYKFWKIKEDFRWGLTLIYNYKGKTDEKYLKQRASEENVLDVLKKAKNKIAYEVKKNGPDLGL
jgi:hypothetical protein